MPKTELISFDSAVRCVPIVLPGQISAENELGVDNAGNWCSLQKDWNQWTPQWYVCCLEDTMAYILLKIIQLCF